MTMCTFTSSPGRTAGSAASYGLCASASACALSGTAPAPFERERSGVRQRSGMTPERVFAVRVLADDGDLIAG